MTRNLAIPTPAKNPYLWLGAAAVLLLGVIVLARKLAAKPKTLFFPGDEIRMTQGGQFTVRLPRGHYSISGDDLQIISELSTGTATDVVMAIMTTNPDPFTINATAVEQASGDTYPVTVIAYPYQGVA